MPSYKQLKKLLHDCYVELYKQSEPSADFNKILEEAEIDQFGFKVIPYMDHEIDRNKCMEIIDSFTKKMSGFQSRQFKQTVLLGCHPKFGDSNY